MKAVLKPERFPWRRLMQLGIGSLGISPPEFWRCTLREITSALSLAAQPLHRQNLNDLMGQWPDDDQL